MLTRAETIVVLWFLPVVLQIVLPLIVLVCWLLIKPFRGEHLEEPSTIDRKMKPRGYETVPQ